MKILSVLVGCACLLAGCDKPPPTPVEIPATQPSSAPQATSSPRLVVLSPAIAIILRDLGLASQIVGRHGYDMILPGSIPICGDMTGIDYETLLRASPTHIILQKGADPLPPRLVELAGKHHWTILNDPLLTLDDIRATTLRLRSLFPVDPSRESLATPGSDQSARHQPTAEELTQRFDRAWSIHVPALAPAGRVLLLYSTDPPTALGPGSCHHQILERIGATPAIMTGSPSITLDAEDVLRLAPDVIILIQPTGPNVKPSPETGHAAQDQELQKRLGILAKLDIPAVKNARVKLIDDPLGLTPSTAMIGLADEMAKTLEAWAK